MPYQARPSRLGILVVNSISALVHVLCPGPNVSWQAAYNGKRPVSIALLFSRIGQPCSSRSYCEARNASALFPTYCIEVPSPGISAPASGTPESSISPTISPAVPQATAITTSATIQPSLCITTPFDGRRTTRQARAVVLNARKPFELEE